MDACNKSCNIISRICVILINILFMIFGLVVMIVGVVIKVKRDGLIKDVGVFVTAITGTAVANESLNDALSNVLSAMSIPLIVLGVIVLLIAVLGCVAGCIQNRSLLITYAIVVGIVGIVMIIITILIYGGYVLSKVRGELESVIATVYVGSLYAVQSKIATVSITDPNNDTTGKTSFIDYTQNHFKCCGLKNYSEYESASKWNKRVTVSGTVQTLTVPVACCIGLNPYDEPKLLACINKPDSSNSYIETPCWPKLEKEFNKTRVAGITVCAILILLTLSLFCMVLFIYRTALDGQSPTHWSDGTTNRNAQSKKPDMYIPGYEPKENQYNRNNQFKTPGSNMNSVASSAHTPDWYSPDRNFNNQRVMTGASAYNSNIMFGSSHPQY